MTIVKLTAGKYIEYSKSGDCPTSKVMNAASALALLLDYMKHDNLVLQKGWSKSRERAEAKKLFKLLEQTGTSDKYKAVDLDFVLEYNAAGPNGECLTLAQILQQYA